MDRVIRDLEGNDVKHFFNWITALKGVMATPAHSWIPSSIRHRRDDRHLHPGWILSWPLLPRESRRIFLVEVSQDDPYLVLPIKYSL
jgi:hypothetical protein